MPMGIGLGIGVTRGGGVGWWPAGSELALEFDNQRGFNSIDRTKTTPDSILTYAAPSPKMVYGSDGVLGYAPHNLLLQSQTFETASWLKNNCTVTANAAVAPDGTTTADFIIPNAASASYKAVQHANNVNPGVAVATASIYVKTNGYGFISFVATSSLGRLTIELSTGAYTNYGAALTATSTAVGDGWYRVVVNVPGYTVSASVWWGPNSAQRDPASSWTSDGVSGIYIWGAQLNLGSSALTYIPTTTAAVYSLPIDHNPTTFDPLGVLIEEQRTNLLLRSQEFNDAIWLKTRSTVTANAAVAPDGNTTADKLIPSVDNSSHYIIETGVTIVTATAYTMTVYAKAGEYNWIAITSENNTDYVSFDLTNGVVGTQSGATGTITNVGNGWYRITCTDTSADTSGTFGIYVLNATAGFAFAGNASDGLYIWGAQVEAGAFPTSYIPTVASQVTRAADQVSILTSAFGYNAAAGTMVFAGDGSPNGTLYTLSDGTTDERIQAYLDPASPRLLVIDGGNTQASLADISVGANTVFKHAAAWTANDFATSLNGRAVIPDATGTLPTLDRLSLGQRITLIAQLNGHIKRLTYFPVRKTNAELQVLST